MAEEYRVILQPEAIEGLESAYAYIKEQSPERANEWVNGLIRAIETLKTFPARCQIARESEHFQQEIRQLLYGKGGNAYRVLFTIVDDTVFVLHMRHGAQDTLRPDISS